jgi:hypothetical protein
MNLRSKRLRSGQDSRQKDVKKYRCDGGSHARTEYMIEITSQTTIRYF